MNKATFGAICLIAGLFIGFFFQCKWDGNQDSKTGLIALPSKGSEARAIDPIKIISNAEEATIHLFEISAPSVVNEEAINSNNDLLLTLEKYKPGEQIRMKVMRNDQPATINVTLGSSL